MVVQFELQWWNLGSTRIGANLITIMQFILILQEIALLTVFRDSSSFVLYINKPSTSALQD